MHLSMVEPSNTIFPSFFLFSSMMIAASKYCPFSRRRYFTNEVMVLFSYSMVEPSNTMFLFSFFFDDDCRVEVST